MIVPSRFATKVNALPKNQRDLIYAVETRKPGTSESLAEETIASLCQIGNTERRYMPDTRDGFTHKFSVAGHDGYVTVGLFEDGTPGEVFIVMAKEGSTVSGFCDAWSISLSLMLQYGVPLEKLIEKFKNVRFEPQGTTTSEVGELDEKTGQRTVTSIVDYVIRLLEMKFIRKAVA